MDDVEVTTDGGDGGSDDGDDDGGEFGSVRVRACAPREQGPVNYP